MNTTEVNTINYADYTDYPDDASPCSTDTSPVRTIIYQPVLFYLVFTLGLTGNSLVLWVLLKYMKLKTMTDICLLNLALSDLLLVLSLPLWAYQAQGYEFEGHSPCKIMAGVYQVGFYSGILFVTLMSVDRYLAIVHAVSSIRARTLHYGTLASTVIWVASIGASIPQAIFSEVVRDDEGLTCRPHYPEGTVRTWKLFRNTVENVTGLLLCLPIMTFCYVSILTVLQRSRNSKKERAVKLIFIIVGAYVVFWIPYNIVVFLQTLEIFGVGRNCEASQRAFIATCVTETIALVHCCVNPVIYAFVGEKFRKCLGTVLSRYPLFKHFSKDAMVTSKGSEYETSNTHV
ncbi:C-C chemokine receptor type 4 [Esox lucius]|uniref:G-protein coupled receptors family 1 profile domain-containing protein n=1 Tax=Esox lucius TaxID=8010 RepID=A0AAY5JZU4_ESOLU|nr:C-C chemokine receptor type 4 [Esox lucius]XP_010895267.1 C-C chemokine receptor type 4 [Esox lucius]